MADGFYVGVDTGGTFTDCVVVDATGRVTTAKAASTPPDFSRGVLDALERAAQALGGLTVKQLLGRARFIGHGTTVGTNTLLTRTGARTGLITTRGHEDTLFMGRIKQKVAGMNEDQLHDFLIDYKGAVVVALDEDEVRGTLRRLVDEDRCEAVAVCLLWSFMNPAHERRVA